MDTQAKHTPGPWKSIGKGIIMGAQGEHVASHVMEPDDATLIAAASDMYEALRDLLSAFRTIGTQEDYDAYSEALYDAEAALARVEGHNA